MVRRLIYGTAMVITLSGIIHILIILLIPSYATKDSWAKLANIGEPWSFSVISQPGVKQDLIPLADPAFGVAACRFNLDEAPVHVSAQGNLPYWSVAIFDRRGQNVYSFNDRTAVERQLQLIVVNPVQMAQIRKSPPQEVKQAVLVESTARQGFILIRALQEDESWANETERFLRDSRCERFDIEKTIG